MRDKYAIFPQVNNVFFLEFGPRGIRLKNCVSITSSYVDNTYTDTHKQVKQIKRVQYAGNTLTTACRGIETFTRLWRVKYFQVWQGP